MGSPQQPSIGALISRTIVDARKLATAQVDLAKADAKPELVAMAEENHHIAHAQLLRDQGRWRYVS